LLHIVLIQLLAAKPNKPIINIIIINKPIIINLDSLNRYLNWSNFLLIQNVIPKELESVKSGSRTNNVQIKHYDFVQASELFQPIS